MPNKLQKETETKNEKLSTIIAKVKDKNGTINKINNFITLKMDFV